MGKEGDRIETSIPPCLKRALLERDRECNGGVCRAVPGRHEAEDARTTEASAFPVVFGAGGRFIFSPGSVNLPAKLLEKESLS